MSWMIIGLGKGLLVLWAIIVKHRYSYLSPYAFIISKNDRKLSVVFSCFLVIILSHLDSSTFSPMKSSLETFRKTQLLRSCQFLQQKHIFITEKIKNFLPIESVIKPYHIRGFYPFLPFWFKNVIIFYEKLSKNSNLCC